MVVYLMGYMGCGKSTIGKKIAKILGLSFIDLDEYIENKYRISISDIFSTKGEAYFRTIESETLKEVSIINNAVISLGGGTPCFNDNIAFIKKSGVSVYIKLPVRVLFDRLKQAKQSRPLIVNKTDNELLDFISLSLKNREGYYEQADIIFEDLAFNKVSLNRLSAEISSKL